MAQVHFGNRENFVIPDEDIISRQSKRRRKGDASNGMMGVGSLFRFFSVDGTRGKWRQSQSNITGEVEPSDGHPHEELVPDFCLFRPLSFNNVTWTLYWPDLIV